MTDQVVQAAHVIEGEAEIDVMNVLVKHFGKETPAGRSIDVDEAVLVLGRLMVQLTASMSDSYRAAIFGAISDKAREVHGNLIVQTHRGGSA